jgi:hypothetical protein
LTRARLEVYAAVLCAVAALACQSPAPPAPRSASAPSPGSGLFDKAGAWEDLQAFAAIGPRVMGTEGAAEARRYIVSQLAELGLQTEMQGVRVERDGEDSLRIENVAAMVPGASSDVILLIAPYDTRPYATFRHQGVNEGGSGAAVLLELARSLSRQELPYTVWFVFLEGEAPLGEGPLAEPSHFGSRGLAERLVALGAVEHVRLGVVIDRVCDADLVIARDIGSHRIYREEFWHAARRIERTEAFPRRSEYQSPRSSQEALSAVGVSRMVTLSDTSFGGDEPPGLYAGNEDDSIEHCSPESLETVGLVTLEALDTITRRLARIDRFSRSPVEGAAALHVEQLREQEAAEAQDAPAGEEEPAAEAQDAPAEEGEPAAEAQDAPAEEGEPAAEAQDAGAGAASPEATP